MDCKHTAKYNLLTYQYSVTKLNYNKLTADHRGKVKDDRQRFLQKVSKKQFRTQTRVGSTNG